MKIKTAGDLLTASTRGWGKEKIEKKKKKRENSSFFFLSRAPPSFLLSMNSRTRRFSNGKRKQRLCTG